MRFLYLLGTVIFTVLKFGQWMAVKYYIVYISIKNISGRPIK